MKFFYYFRPDGDGDGGNMGGESGAPAATPDAPAPDSGDTGEETGSTTPEEVAEILHLPQNTPAVDNDEDDTVVPDDTGDEEDVVPDAPDENPDEPPAPADDPAPDEDPTKTPADEVVDETPDFSFTITDKDGVAWKVGPDDDIDTVLQDFTPTGTGQLITIMNQLNEARAAQADYTAEQEAKAAEQSQQQSAAVIQEQWNKEIASLVADKRIEASSDINNSERVKAVFSFMGEENAKRTEEGRPLLASFEDALDKLEVRERREAETAQAKQARETARKNGALVGGSSAPAGNGPKPYVAGSARNSTEALRQAGLL